jgi:hypothetical protein
MYASQIPGERMRGEDPKQEAMFSYVSPEQRVPADHPLRPIREMVDGILKEMSPRFAGLYAQVGRPSIAPERLLRALLLQIFYSVRSERLLIEQLDYNLLFRWFVGMEMPPTRRVTLGGDKNYDTGDSHRFKYCNHGRAIMQGKGTRIASQAQYGVKVCAWCHDMSGIEWVRVAGQRLDYERYSVGTRQRFPIKARRDLRHSLQRAENGHGDYCCYHNTPPANRFHGIPFVLHTARSLFFDTRLGNAHGVGTANMSLGGTNCRL